MSLPGLAGIFAGARIVFARPALRTPMVFGLLAAFYNAPEGVAAPLAGALGGGAAAVGVILAANSLGQTAGAIAFSRFVAPPTRLRFMGPLAISACAVLVLFFWKPDLSISLLILVASGLCAAYQLAANAAFVGAAPQEQRSQAFGLAQGTMSLSQGSSDDSGGGRSRTPRAGAGDRGVRRCRRRGCAGGHGRRGPRSRPADKRRPPERLRSGPLGVAHGGLLSLRLSLRIGGWRGPGQVHLVSRTADSCSSRYGGSGREGRGGGLRSGPGAVARRIVSLSAHLNPLSD